MPGVVGIATQGTLAGKREEFTLWEVFERALSFAWEGGLKVAIYRKITAEDFAKYYNLGYSDQKIADAIGVHKISIFNYRKSRCIPTNHPNMGRSQVKILEKYIPCDADKPWKDPESLFCDGAFLEKLVRGNVEDEVKENKTGVEL